MLRVEFAEQQWKVEKRIETGTRSDAQRATLQSADRRYSLPGLARTCEDLSSFFVKDAPCDGQFHSAGGSNEERRPKLAFERANGRRKARLNDVHFASRAGEVLFLSGGDEVFELLEIHATAANVIHL
jgi:hypothetical protein